MEQPSFQPEITSDDKLWALLAYIFTPLIPLVILLMPDKKDRPFLKAHNMQALILGVIEWVINCCVELHCDWLHHQCDHDHRQYLPGRQSQQG